MQIYYCETCLHYKKPICRDEKHAIRLKNKNPACNYYTDYSGNMPIQLPNSSKDLEYLSFTLNSQESLILSTFINRMKNHANIHELKVINKIYDKIQNPYYPLPIPQKKKKKVILVTPETLKTKKKKSEKIKKNLVKMSLQKNKPTNNSSESSINKFIDRPNPRKIPDKLKKLT